MGHSQTTSTAIGGGGHGISTLLNKLGNFYYISKAVNKEGGGQMGRKYVIAVCE